MARARTETVKTECQACSGSGVYCGMAEARYPGVAVVCQRCGGSGCHELVYIPFVERHIVHGIKTVYRSGGSGILGPMGPKGAGITYAEFQAGKLP